MNWRFKNHFRLAVAAGVLASLAAVAAVTPNPYGSIAGSNVFKLQPPRPQDPVIEQPKPRPPLPKVSITGLVQMGGVSKALVEITETGKPVNRPILAAGGTFGVLEILHIDVAGERVRVRLDGEEETLSIEKPKPSTVAPPPPPVPQPRATAAVRG